MATSIPSLRRTGPLASTPFSSAVPTAGSTPKPEPTVSASTPSTRLGAVAIDTSERVGSIAPVVFKPGFGVPSSVVLAVRTLEGRLTGERSEAETKRTFAANTETRKQSSWSSLTFWDKYFRWIPMFHNKLQIGAYKQAKGGDAQADVDAAAALKRANATDGEVVQTIASYLRTAPGSTFGELEQRHLEASRLHEVVSSYRRAVNDAFDALENAASAKQWDAISDLTSKANKGMDFTDVNAMTQLSAARAQVARVKGEAQGFKVALASYRGQVVGTVGGLGAVSELSVGQDFLDFFMTDSPLFGMMRVMELQRANRSLETLAAQLTAIGEQVQAHVDHFASAMDAQTEAVRQACA